MICKNCGAQIPDDSLICDKCGASALDEMSDFNDETKVIDADELKAAAAVESAQATGETIEEAKNDVYSVNDENRHEQMRKMREDKQKQLSEIEKRRAAKRKKQRRIKAIVVGILCAMAVGAAGIGAYFIAKGIGVTNGTKPSATVTPTAVATAMPSATPSSSPMASPGASPMPSATAGTDANANQSWTATNGGKASSSSQSGSNNSSQRTASNTTQRTASSTVSSSSSTGKSGSAAAGTNSSSASQSKSGASGKTYSGIVTAPISSGTVTGGEVVYNQGTGKYLMTFDMDGKTYYANVSAGSTTAQIQGKKYTINADATSDSYDGNTVYEISSMEKQSASSSGTQAKSSGYIFSDTDSRLLTSKDIAGMSKYDLALARNEIFARHGRKFKTKSYADYFGSKSWYKINPNYNYSDDMANLNSTEKQNVKFILSAEK